MSTAELSNPKFIAFLAAGAFTIALNIAALANDEWIKNTESGLFKFGSTEVADFCSPTPNGFGAVCGKTQATAAFALIGLFATIGGIVLTFLKKNLFGLIALVVAVCSYIICVGVYGSILDDLVSGTELGPGFALICVCAVLSIASATIAKLLSA